MASFFRKLGRNIVPMFRKLPSDVATITRKISSGTGKVESGIGSVQNFLNKYGGSNPLAKTIGQGLETVKDITGGVGLASQALGQASQGHFGEAGKLGLQALKRGKEVVGDVGSLAGSVGKGALKVAPIALL